jgi:two-component system response regulator HydG
VRELENLIERLVVIGSTPEIDAERVGALLPSEKDRFAFGRDKLATLRELEDEYIAWVLKRCGNNKARAAEVLGIDPSTLHRRARSRG